MYILHTKEILSEKMEKNVKEKENSVHIVRNMYVHMIPYR